MSTHASMLAASRCARPSSGSVHSHSGSSQARIGNWPDPMRGRIGNWPDPMAGFIGNWPDPMAKGSLAAGS
jgi:hypothetical protein